MAVFFRLRHSAVLCCLVCALVWSGTADAKRRKAAPPANEPLDVVVLPFAVLRGNDANAAFRLNERAKRLYLRAHRHAMLALELSSPGFAAKLAQPNAGQWPVLSKNQLGLAYWAAASWGGYISLSKDVPDTVADLPLAYRLAGLAWKVDPHYDNGGLASLMGSFEAAVPGGSIPRAAEYFDSAIAISGGKSAGPFVAKAESVAQAQGHREAFELLLRKAIEASDLRRDLANEVMRERAQWLLKSADDLF